MFEVQTAVRGVDDALLPAGRAFSSRFACCSPLVSPLSNVFFTSPPSSSSTSPSSSPSVFFTSSLHWLTFLPDEGGENVNGSENGNYRGKNKDKDNVLSHLLTKIAEKVDKVADKDKADGGDVQEHRSVVLAVPNVAVLPDDYDEYSVCSHYGKSAQKRSDDNLMMEEP